jgi:RNA recognition motif-containing protein
MKMIRWFVILVLLLSSALAICGQTKLKVTNLDYKVNADELRGAFEAYGSVQCAEIIFDQDTGQSRGLAFVVMDDREEAEKAAFALNGSQLRGRNIGVNIIRAEKLDCR